MSTMYPGGTSRIASSSEIEIDLTRRSTGGLGAIVAVPATVANPNPKDEEEEDEAAVVIIVEEEEEEEE